MRQAHPDMPISKQAVLLLILLAAPLSCLGDPTTQAIPDLMREQRLAAEASGAILDGESMALQAADGQRFLAIHTQAAATPTRGTVIILHGRGQHPDAVDVVHPLDDREHGLLQIGRFCGFNGSHQQRQMQWPAAYK
jgi:hypothetical protein